MVPFTWMQYSKCMDSKPEKRHGKTGEGAEKSCKSALSYEERLESVGYS